MNGDRWHKGSRFWMIGTQALWLSWSLVILCAWQAPQAIEEAIGAFSLVAFALLGGGAASNFQQARATVRDAQSGGAS